MSAAFWDWSLKTYDQLDVARRLLALQDQLGLNVNILLWCCWSASRRLEVSELALRKAVDIASQWTGNVAGPLRAARTALKTPPAEAEAEPVAALRRAVKDAELEAERIEQAMLARIEVEPSDEEAPMLSRRALARYAGLAGAVRRPGFSTLLIDDLVRAVFRAEH